MSRKGGKASRWALQDAKNKLSQVVDAAVRGNPQIVTRRGVETAVVISREEFDRLRGASAGAYGSFAQCLLAMPTSATDDIDRIELTVRDWEDDWGE